LYRDFGRIYLKKEEKEAIFFKIEIMGHFISKRGFELNHFNNVYNSKNYSYNNMKKDAEIVFFTFAKKIRKI